jgi:hypothetical protein
VSIHENAWCQRWHQRRHSWRHRSEGGFDASRYEVAPVEEADAMSFVRRHHYSGTYPAARLRYGLYEGSALVGVAVLSVPVQQSVLTKAFPNLLPYDESIELGRFVLLDRVPGNAESWFLAQAFRLAERDGVRGVVSFSDPMARRSAGGDIVFPGHIGTIYQASNARYLGRSTARSLLLLPDGTVLNDRAVQKIRSGEQGSEYAERRLVEWGAPRRRGSEVRSEWLAGALGAANVRRVRHPGNHRYAFLLGPRRERRAIEVGLPTSPYPKRTEGVAA